MQFAVLAPKRPKPAAVVSLASLTCSGVIKHEAGLTAYEQGPSVHDWIWLGDRPAWRRKLTASGVPPTRACAIGAAMATAASASTGQRIRRLL